MAALQVALFEPEVFSPNRCRRIGLPDGQRMVSYRCGTSDLIVYWQVFVSRYYQIEQDALPPGCLVIDGGANVGYSSVWFLTNYPQIRKVVAVEPDAANLELARLNLAPFGDRVQFVQAGIGGKAGYLKLNRSSSSQGNEFARQFVSAKDSGPDLIKAITLEELAQSSEETCINLLKLDIEGAEIEVFRSASPHFWDTVDLLMLELHGEEAEKVFFAVFGSIPGWNLTRQHDLWVARRIRLT